MFNSKFTRHCTEWGLKYAHHKTIAGALSENGKVYALDLDDRDIYKIDYYLFESFTSIRSISLRGHSINNEK